MIAELTPKQAYEAYYISFVFTDAMATGESVSSATVTAADMADASDVSLTLLDSTKQSISGQIVYVWVRAGTDAHTYRITCKVQSSTSEKYELEAILPVRDIPATPPSMGTGIITAPVIEPVTLEEVKDHLLIDETTAAADNQLMRMIKAARQQIEDWTRRAILTQTWDYCLQAWPGGKFIAIPHGNLQSVSSVKWKDEDATETTLTETTDYLVEQNGTMCGRIVLPYATGWPSGVLYPSNPITIRYVCGWSTPELVPETIKAAILMTVADMYENRSVQEFNTINQGFSVNKSVEMLLASQRLWM